MLKRAAHLPDRVMGPVPTARDVNSDVLTTTPTTPTVAAAVAPATQTAPTAPTAPTGPWDRRYRTTLLLTDATAVVVALATAQLTRFGGGAAQLTVLGHGVDYRLVGLLVALVWLVALGAGNSRRRRVVGAGSEEYRCIVAATFAAFGGLAILSYLGALQLSRFYFVVALPVGLVLVLGARLAWRLRLGRARAQGRAMTATVVVGGPGEVAAAVADMRRHPEAGYVPVAVALTTGGATAEPGSAPLPGLPRVSIDEVRRTGRGPGPGAVLVAGGVSRESVRRLAWDLEDGGAELLLVSQLTDVAGPRIHQSPVDGLPVVHVDPPRFSGGPYVLKRAMDIVISSAALVLLAPVYAAVALAIKLDDGGPVLFRQERVGQHGVPFRMHKFRSMAVDAEARLTEVRHLATGDQVLFKLPRDPRVTQVGGFLRRHSLDELPQFWDVLRGRMSVVGPRPPLPSEVREYQGHTHRRLLIRPGITGLWQVSGRSDLSWTESVRLDLRYVENWSVSGDLVLVLRTARAVLGGRGAY